MKRTPSETSAFNREAAALPQQRAVQQPNQERFLTSFVYEEMTEALLSALHRVVPLLPPATRMKLLAFVQLLRSPEIVQADFAVESSGSLRLILAADSAGKAPAQTEPPHASSGAGRSP